MIASVLRQGAARPAASPKAGHVGGTRELRTLILHDVDAGYERLLDVVAANGGIVVGRRMTDIHRVPAQFSGESWDLAILSLTEAADRVLELLREIRRTEPQVPLLVHSRHSERRYAQRTLHAGACGYVTTSDDDERLRTAIRKVVAGHVYVSDEAAEEMARECMPDAAPRPHKALSDREYQILLMMIDGYEPVQLARTLGLNIRTVRTHKHGILKALGLAESAALQAYAEMHGLRH